MTIGSRIKECLKEKKIKQGHFAKTLGVSAAAITQIINDEYIPKNTTLTSIATALSINVKWLLTGEGTKDLIVSDERQKREVIDDTLIEENNRLKNKLEEVYHKIIPIVNDLEEQIFKLREELRSLRK